MQSHRITANVAIGDRKLPALCDKRVDQRAEIVEAVENHGRNDKAGGTGELRYGTVLSGRAPDTAETDP